MSELGHKADVNSSDAGCLLSMQTCRVHAKQPENTGGQGKSENATSMVRLIAMVIRIADISIAVSFRTDLGHASRQI
jgi:hypothetical protein